MKKAMPSPDLPEVIPAVEPAAPQRPGGTADATESMSEAKTSSAAPAEQPDDFTVKAKFGALVVLCKACQKRSSGPSKLKVKDLRKEMRRDPARSTLRLRIVESGCLGLCPKKAIAAAAMARGGQMQMAEIKEASQASRLLAVLQKPAA
ncbi:conserved hypothetical protein [Burkholderiales bacterium 8X]|nr:conserved hypothetical protein [Burkholderiales bacterium 8X]